METLPLGHNGNVPPGGAGLVAPGKRKKPAFPKEADIPWQIPLRACDGDQTGHCETPLPGGNAWNSLLKDGIAYTKSVSNNRGGTRKFSRQKHQQNDKDSEQYKSHFPCGKTFRSLKKPENSENVFFPESPRIFAIPIFLLLFISSNFCKIPRKEPPQLPGSFSAGKKISCYRVDSI
jgi:hypothetical protein